MRKAFCDRAHSSRSFNQLHSRLLTNVPRGVTCNFLMHDLSNIHGVHFLLLTINRALSTCVGNRRVLFPRHTLPLRNDDGIRIHSVVACIYHQQIHCVPKISRIINNKQKRRVSTASKFYSYRHSAASVDRRYISTHTRARARAFFIRGWKLEENTSVWLITQIDDGLRGGVNTRYILALTAKLIPICNALSCLQYRCAACRYLSSRPTRRVNIT